jgi:tRNA A37 threonylcarbamoyladenosine biosynthesis protein TsaE
VGGYEQSPAGLGVAEPEFYRVGQAAEVLLQYTGNTGVFAFYGQMGVSKTTFIKALCEVLGTGD